MDPSLIGTVDIAAGAGPDSGFIINTARDAARLCEQIEFGPMGFHYLDATRISEEEIGRDIPNSVIMGAIVKATGLFNKEKFEQILGEQMRHHFTPKIAEANMRCFQRGYEEVVEG